MSKCINVDELQEWVENWFYKNRCYHPYAKSNTIPIKELYDILENMPSADVVEVRHGQWEVRFVFEDCRYVKCNQCKVTQVFHYNKPLANFCPNCGAKMDLEGDIE